MFMTYKRTQRYNVKTTPQDHLKVAAGGHHPEARGSPYLKE
jgi:hypothetical protein